MHANARSLIIVCDYVRAQGHWTFSIQLADDQGVVLDQQTTHPANRQVGWATVLDLIQAPVNVVHQHLHIAEEQAILDMVTQYRGMKYLNRKVLMVIEYDSAKGVTNLYYEDTSFGRILGQPRNVRQIVVNGHRNVPDSLVVQSPDLLDLIPF